MKGKDPQHKIFACLRAYQMHKASSSEIKTGKLCKENIKAVPSSSKS